MPLLTKKPSMLPAGLQECRHGSESHESGSLRYRAATAKMAPKESLIVAYYDDNPDYTLRWPPELFALEAELLVRRGAELGTGSDWPEEVALLLRQAFVSPVPANDFDKVARAHAQELAQARKAAQPRKTAQPQKAARARRALAEDDEPF